MLNQLNKAEIPAGQVHGLRILRFRLPGAPRSSCAIKAHHLPAMLDELMSAAGGAE